MKCKKIIVILLSLALVLSLIPFVSQEAQAASTGSGKTGPLSWSLNSSGTLTISGTGAMPDYGWDEGDITRPWAQNVGQIKKVVIKSGVTNIGNCSFQNCTKLESITIPDSVTRIGEDAFSACYALTGIKLPAGLLSLEKRTFSDCNALTSIVIPSGIEVISEATFAECWALTDVVLPDGLVRIDRAAFYKCTHLVNIEIPSSVQYIGDQAFFYCTKLESISVPNGVNALEFGTFINCSSMKTITIPSSVTSIESQVFDRNESLTDVIYTGTQTQWDKISIDETCNERLFNAKLTCLGTGPVITTQPKAQSVTAGTKVSLKVAASGTGLAYQWQSSTNGTTWKDCSSTGYNKATFSFTASAALNGRQYRCVVKNTDGTEISKAVKLTVISAPSITTQPKSASVTLGTTASFTVAASSGGLSYQWQYSKNGGTTWVNWSGKTAASLEVKASNTNNGCLYRCRVTNSAGSVTSSSAKLTITNVKPTITTQPASVKVNAGTKVTFKVTAAGSGLKYQWQFSDDGTTWKNCKSTGYNTASFSFNASAGLNNRQYRCVVSNAYGSTTSDAGKLTVVTKPVITSQPKAASVTAGTKVSFSVTAEGPGLKYQWQYSDDGTTWKNCKSTGYNTATFSFTASTSLNGRQYRCVVSNAYGSTTSGAGKLTVK